MDIIKTVSEIIFYLGSVIAICVSAYQYWENSKLKRAEWLMTLFEKFYEHPQYKEIRRRLDDDPKKVSEYLSDIGKNTDKEEKLVDYLNFFVLIETLIEMGQMKEEEVKKMFSYYIKKLSQSPELMRYIERYSFNQVKALIDNNKIK